MRYIACATGSSVARDVQPLAADGDAARFKRAIAERCRTVMTGNPENYRQLVCAEINSLERLESSRGDDVLLLHSDTEDGRICAEQVRDLINSEFGCHVKVEKIAGLQATDPERFRRSGVPGLFSCLDRYRRNLGGGDELIINATAGFKAVAPYLTIYAMLKRHRVIYLFEGSPNLIELPPAPLSFDWRRLTSVSDALLQVSRNEIISRRDFDLLIAHVPHEDREWSECLWDRLDDAVILSAFGQIVAGAMSEAEGVNVLLSPEARESLKTSVGAVREQYLFMLSRVGNPLQRAQHMHAIHGSDLLIWKPGRTAERMEYFIKGNEIYVCALHQHQYTGTNRQDYDGCAFTSFTAPALAVTTQRELEESWERRLKDAEDERAAANTLFSEAEQELKNTRRCLEEVNQALIAKQEEIDRESKGLAEAISTISRLESELARLRLPWWRRLLGPT